MKSGAQDPPPKVKKVKVAATNMICDVSKLYGPHVNGLNTLETTAPDGKIIEARVNCKESKCSPAMPGPSNACVYICGKPKCG